MDKTTEIRIQMSDLSVVEKRALVGMAIMDKKKYEKIDPPH